MTRVLVVDDEAMIRDGLALIIEVEPALELAGTAAGGQQAAAHCDAEPPDVVLMDLHMPGWDGVRATRYISERHPGVRIVALTTFDAEHMVWEALRAGACGYLLKDTSRQRLVDAIQAAAAGETPISPSLLSMITGRFTTAPRPAASGIPPELDALSERELDVLRLVAAGETNAGIAAQLHIGQATVKTHLANMLAKLGAHDRVQAVITAYETGLVRPGTRSAPPHQARPGK
ncbi:MAG TPA: response regulator transcription factor [Trebonia sp.]